MGRADQKNSKHPKNPKLTRAQKFFLKGWNDKKKVWYEYAWEINVVKEVAKTLLLKL